MHEMAVEFAVEAMVRGYTNIRMSGRLKLEKLCNVIAEHT